MWSSLDDETKEIAKEIVRNDALDRVILGLGYFDASILGQTAWTVVPAEHAEGSAVRCCMSTWKTLKEMQGRSRFTELIVATGGGAEGDDPRGASHGMISREVMGAPVRGKTGMKKCAVC
ncbi:MAG: L-rhamnose isomerase [Lachnospiraceae bacterium]